MKLILIAALLVSPIAYRNGIALSQITKLAQEFNIKIGQEVLVEDLRIGFDAVADDRRCGCDQQCSSLRNAAVILSVRSPKSVSKKIVLTAYSDSEPYEARSRGYTIRLLKLDPCRKSNLGSISSSEYQATLLVTKSQTESGNDQNSNLAEQGQTKPNFSGGWRHREAVDAGVTLIVSHSGPEMEVTRRRFAKGRDSVTQKKYWIDGKAHDEKQVEYIENSSTNQKEGYKTGMLRSLVKWDENRLVIEEQNERYEWELSEDGKHLILTTGTGKTVYQKIDKK